MSLVTASLQTLQSSARFGLRAARVMCRPAAGLAIVLSATSAIPAQLSLTPAPISATGRLTTQGAFRVAVPIELAGGIVAKSAFKVPVPINVAGSLTTSGAFITAKK